MSTQQPRQVADDAGRLAAGELQHVRVDRLRHDRRAGAERLRQLDEVELRGAPQNPPSAYVLRCSAMSESGERETRWRSRGRSTIPASCGRRLRNRAACATSCRSIGERGAARARAAPRLRTLTRLRQSAQPTPAVAAPAFRCTRASSAGPNNGRARCMCVYAGRMTSRSASQRPTNAFLEIEQAGVDDVDRRRGPKLARSGRDLVVAAAGGVQLSAYVAGPLDGAFSTCMWMSSSSVRNGNLPCSISWRIASRPCSIWRHSSADDSDRPCASIWAWAIEQRMSCA